MEDVLTDVTYFRFDWVDEISQHQMSQQEGLLPTFGLWSFNVMNGFCLGMDCLGVRI